MEELEVLIGLILAATLLAALARRVGAPYPVFLALGGALLAFVPGAPSFTVLPELALALFVAPILLDAAYDASPRDLRDNWAPVTGLVVVAVGLTTLAVAVVVRALIPEMPWAPAIALGAVVAPPDAAAATAVLRQLRPPHRILTILEGESLLNDASALLIYRLAVGAVAANGFSIGAVAPAFLFAVIGSIVIGPALGWISIRLNDRVRDVPTAIIIQFVTTFGVWILAERIGLSGVLTMVCYAITVARTAPARIPARLRIPSYAVWETVVFVLNVLAFVFIGLQIRPIFDSLDPAMRGRYFVVAGAVLVTVIVVRIAWHMSFNAVIRWQDRRFGFRPPRPMLRPTVGSGLVISWSGMRGIVTLAAALALPAGFPFRDLIVVTAFSVVLGTLVAAGAHAWAAPARARPARRRSGRTRSQRGSCQGFACRARGPRTRPIAVAKAVRQELRAHLAPTRDHPAGGGRGSARPTRQPTGGRCRPRVTRFSRCGKAKKSATTPSINWKRSSTGSRCPPAEKKIPRGEDNVRNSALRNLLTCSTYGL